MRHNKLNSNPKSKLSKLIDQKEEDHKSEFLNIINPEIKISPTSFRLRRIDTERLDETLKKINNSNFSHPFNKTYLIRGLIMLATETKSDKILEYIRKSL